MKRVNVFFIGVILFSVILLSNLTFFSLLDCPNRSDKPYVVNVHRPEVNRSKLLSPPSDHTIINVSTIFELDDALQNIESHTTIFISDGTYRVDQLANKQLSPPYGKQIDDIVIRGVSGNPQTVIIEGAGMYSSAGKFGIQIFQSKDVLIADLTIARVYYHCISVHATQETARIHLYNLHLIDAGEQLVKCNPAGNIGVTDLLIENCLFKLSNGWGVHPELGYAYGNGISAHATTNLTIRGCTFQNLYYTTYDLAGPAILIWNEAKDSLIEQNTFINCARGIALGLSDGTGHTGGIIRNNFFYRSTTISSGILVDTAIYIASPNAHVVHNTLVVQDSYYAPIEVRFSTTTNVMVQNNILDGGEIVERDGASATINDNTFEATSNWFTNMVAGDLHLVNNSETRNHVIDQVPVLLLVKNDIDGQERPYGLLADLGADELSSEIIVTSNSQYSNISTTTDFGLVVFLITFLFSGLITIYLRKKRS